MVARGGQIVAVANNCKGISNEGHGEIQIGMCSEGASIRMDPLNATVTIYDLQRGSVTIKDESGSASW